MKINEKKTKSMIINFTNNYQFTTRLLLNETNIEIVDKMKILGTIITDKLTWTENCKELISRVNKRMLLLKQTLSFGATREEMVHLWILYCRSVLEQSAVVWSSSLTQENKDDLERTQKSFAKLVLKDEYKDGDNALLVLNLESLEKHWNHLYSSFANGWIKNHIYDDLFIENNSNPTKTRFSEKYKVLKANTDRMWNSNIIYMQNLLNTEHKRKLEESISNEL